MIIYLKVSSIKQIQGGPVLNRYWMNFILRLASNFKINVSLKDFKLSDYFCCLFYFNNFSKHFNVYSYCSFLFLLAKIKFAYFSKLIFVLFILCFFVFFSVLSRWRRVLSTPIPLKKLDRYQILTGHKGVTCYWEMYWITIF